MNERFQVPRAKNYLAAALIAVVLAAGGGAVSAAALQPDARDDRAGAAAHPSYFERVNPDGTCELVDAAGVPLYDSQFTERTGSSPCDQG